MTSKHRIQAALITVLLLLLTSPARAVDASSYRAQMEKWVETQQLISEESTEWKAEKETLEATRKLLEEEKTALEAEILSLEASSTEADEERRGLLLERGEYQRGERLLEEDILALESGVRRLVPRLPSPLQKKLEPLLVQIPDDPEKTRLRLGQRLMNVLGVLAQVDKFDSTATFVGETRAIDGDQKIQIRTLYWGLGQAIYVDSQGEIGGIGRPTEAGWEFTRDRALADDAKRLLDIYEGNVDTIGFIELPVVVE